MKPKINLLAWWLTAILIALLPFHAFLYTYLHSFFWNASWVIFIQAWKEILVGILGILALINWWGDWQLPRKKSWWLAFIFVFLAVIYTVIGSGETTQKFLGLRSATLFLITFLTLPFFEFSNEKIDVLKKIAIASASLVIAFALTQKFFLPHDFLAHFGYSRNVSSWLPSGNLPMYHLTGPSGVMRLQSTLAGPNQLGAYLLVILPLAWLVRRGAAARSWTWLADFVLVGGGATLVWTFSRSAWLGLLAMALTYTLLAWRKKLSSSVKKNLLIGSSLLALLLSGIIFFDPSSRANLLRTASSSAHLSRSLEAAHLVLRHPLGLGIGKTAGVSQRFDTKENVGLTPENTYLGLALETGWLGGLLFVLLLASLLKELYAKKSPLFYSLIGVMLVGLFLHPLEDSATALTLFLLLSRET